MYDYAEESGGDSLFISQVLIKHIFLYKAWCGALWKNAQKIPRKLINQKIDALVPLYKRDNETSQLTIEMINDYIDDYGKYKCIIMQFSSSYCKVSSL